MRAKNLLKRRFVALLTFGAIVGVAISGFAASNTVPDTNAGDGSGTISGYTIAAVQYTLNAATPSNIDSVSFTVSPIAPGASPAITVKAKVVSASATYTNCTLAAGVWTCDFSPDVTVLSADQLRVIAVQ